ncbi:hypothetical protein T01_8075 [Trichinella spiralis]|uniref:Uncharacterized protein n=1 Tax=Trichinella spiralis TaxID=6334 RepID=A0A0V1BGI4_TRISP|nr:hypothetical protein T01_8075 [Trichinella spiralis]
MLSRTKESYEGQANVHLHNASLKFPHCLIHVHLLILWPWDSVVKVQHHHSLSSTIESYAMLSANGDRRLNSETIICLTSNSNFHLHNASLKFPHCLIHVHLLSLWPWDSVVKVQHHSIYSHVYDLVSTIQNYNYRSSFLFDQTFYLNC